MRRTRCSRALTAVLAAGALSLPIAVSATVTPAAAAEPGAVASAGMLAALERDLGLTADQAHTRVVRDLRATATSNQLAAELGIRYAGSWIAGDHLVVAVADLAAQDRVRAAGAEPVAVAHSERQLDSAKATLDQHLAAAPKSVTRWGVDVVANRVTISTRPGTADSVRGWVAAAGVPADLVSVTETSEAFRPLENVRGGDAYYIDQRERCSVGFSVTGGFVSAGHCGQPGSTTTGYDQVSQGTFQGSQFPGNGDYSWVRVNANWTPTGTVNGYGNGDVQVAGSQEAAVGSSICRSGSTSGWHCGTVLGKNESVSYQEGTVTGLTRTNACAEPGDSGGSWLTGQQAQGVTSGGSGDCTSGGTTYFQPVNEILQVYGLTLVTSGGPNPPPPPPPGGSCNGVAAWSASTAYQPGDLVSYNSHEWKSTYWSTGAQPGAPASWAVWSDQGAC
jgi:streptogrisin C